MNRSALHTQPSLSIRIGRIVVRLLIAYLVIWGAVRLYGIYRDHKRAQEIAPIHAYALDVMAVF
jgi:hypothetical protein